MHPLISKLFFYHPSTLIKGEPIVLLMNQYRRNQWLAPSTLEALRMERLQLILKYAVEQSLHYKNLYHAAGVDIRDIHSLHDFSKLPTVSKSDLIDNIESMSAPGKRWISSSKTTGGSTGQPVKLRKNPLALARERCATWRSYEWAGVSIGDPQLRFWGVPHSQTSRAKATLIDLVANRRRVSAFNLTNESLHQYYTDAYSFKPKYVYGYVSAIEALAKHILNNKLDPLPSVVSVITTSEILTLGSRHTIEAAFQTNVYNEYGCGEVGSIAHECEKGSMHIMADNLLVEIDSAEGPGEIIVTDFFNKATPLIRYRLGDYATLSNKSCTCGRSLPTIESIHGRAYDILQTPSGRSIHPEAIIYIFESLQSKTNAFKQFQAIQTGPDKINIKIIPNKNWNNDVESVLLQQLARDIDAGIEFKIQLTDTLSREASGKMRLVKRDY